MSPWPLAGGDGIHYRDHQVLLEELHHEYPSGAVVESHNTSLRNTTGGFIETSSSSGTL